MIRQIPVQEANIVAYRVSGKLSHAEYQALLPRLEQLIQQHGKLSVLLELVDFRGWDLAAAWDDFRFGMAHPDGFERIAIVGSSALQRWIALMAAPFTTADIRVFEEGQTAEAWNWLREPLREAARDAAEPAPYRSVLVGVDFSAHAIRAVRRALDIARRHGGKVHLVHAVDSQVAYGEAYDAVIPPDIDLEREMVEAAEQRMRKLVDELSVGEVGSSVLVGSPKDVILSQANALHADLIVVGTHGRRGIARLLGSTASGIGHSAPCDVLTVRIGGDR